VSMNLNQLAGPAWFPELSFLGDNYDAEISLATGVLTSDSKMTQVHELTRMTSCRLDPIYRALKSRDPDRD